MNYKLIATDLDGTLLYDVFTVSRENFEAIAEYAAEGGYVVPTSGRCFLEIIPELRECKDIRYCISSNGAVITDLVTGERDEVALSNKLFGDIMEITREYETYHTVHHRDKGYMLAENDSEEKAFYYNLNEHYFAHYHKWCVKLDNLESLYKNGLEAEMVSVFFKKQEQLDECAKRLEKLGGLVITSSAPFNIEIVAEGASKGDGIARLAKKLEISKGEIIGVGDSRNDLAMFEGVGLLLAVSNAVDELKDKAARVICHHRDHIVKYILDNIIE